MKLIMLGPPGVGKGTIAKRISEEFGPVQISTGDLLRDAVKEGTDLGAAAKGFMDSGNLVPDSIVVSLLKERMQEKDCENGFILDGFPRNTAQAKLLDSEGIAIDKVLNMKARDETVVRRITSRRVCRNCGAIYNLIFLKPERDGICDKCGGELYQREDDREEAVKKRLEVYRNQTEPLIRYYKHRGILGDVDAEPSIEEVYSQAKMILQTSG